MQWTFEIPGTLPSLNDYIRAERANRFAAAGLKKKAQAAIVEAMGEEPPRFEGGVEVRVLWVRPDMRTDKDNVAFAKKFILDALQEAGVIAKDSWRLCTPYDSGFLVSKANPRTIVTVRSADSLK